LTFRVSIRLKISQSRARSVNIASVGLKDLGLRRADAFGNIPDNTVQLFGRDGNRLLQTALLVRQLICGNAVERRVAVSSITEQTDSGHRDSAANWRTDEACFEVTSRHIHPSQVIRQDSRSNYGAALNACRLGASR
jgi:hypothetical protein